MSAPGLRRWVDTVATPWRNGGGTTRELASSPAGDDAFAWRISVADVTAAGAFSTFPGVDRTIVLVDGSQLMLTLGGTDHALVRHRPFRFDGDLSVSCSVPFGPARALNVMTRRDRCRAEVDVVDLDRTERWSTPRESFALVIALAGDVHLAGPDGRDITLERFDLYRPPPATDPVLTGSGTVASVTIHPAVDPDRPRDRELPPRREHQ